MSLLKLVGFFIFAFSLYQPLVLCIRLSNPKTIDESLFNLETRSRQVGQQCVSISDCQSGLVCTSGNPLGTCQEAHLLIGLSHLVVNVIQLDYTPRRGGEGINPQNGGPTVTSRAMAIIYLAAHDAFSVCTGLFDLRISTRFRNLLTRRSGTFMRRLQVLASRQDGNPSDFVQKQCQLASIAAGYTAAEILYSNSRRVINFVKRQAISEAAPGILSFGRIFAVLWVRSRSDDGSSGSQTDNIFSLAKPHHQPDPNYNLVTNASGFQENFGRSWGNVRPFVIDDVKADAFLGPFPGTETDEYRTNFTEVKEKGQCNSITLPDGTLLNELATFWGYDGMPGIGVPPRLYLQVILAIPDLHRLPFQDQLRVLTASNAEMADAGIAAWFWKFEYDVWRPVIGIRMDDDEPDPSWNPFGVPFSNIGPDTVPGCVGLNPDFPAYPSGHSTFGTAAFRTFANMLGVEPQDISLEFTSDEFNGVTVEGATNRPRRIITRKLNLADCIQENQDSRVFNGVHWRFDSIGGDIVGSQIAERAAREFSLN